MRLKSLEDMQQAEFAISQVGQTIKVSVFYLDGLLIDTGPVRKKAEVLSLCEDWDVEAVILTHHHEDHTGCAHWVQEDKGVPIYIHTEAVEGCATRMKLPLYRKVFWGERKPFQALPLGDTYRTANYSWDVIHTPGHAVDHIALYNREKGWLFGGDLFVQPHPKSMFRFESAPEQIESLRKILQYDFQTYVCSHAGVIQDGRKAIERKLNYLVDVQSRVFDLHNKGMSAKTIRKMLFPGHHPMHYLSFFENSPKHLIESILGKEK